MSQELLKMESTSKPLEVRAVHTSELRTAVSTDGTRTISGLIPYNSQSVDLGGFVEVVAEGCFEEALKPGADILCLRDHSSQLLLGRTKSGTMKLEDSPEGLRYTVNLPNTTVANDLAASIDRGDLDATSFGFVVKQDKWTAVGDTVLRTLLKVELFEISAVSFPAYPESTVSIRSCPNELRSKMQRDDMTEESASMDEEDCPCQDAFGNCMCQKDDDGNCLKDEDGNCIPMDDSDANRSLMHMVLTLRQKRK